MNKKLLWAMALPVAFASCSQEDLVSEGVAAPEGKAITGLTLNVAKNDDATSRAAWENNKIAFDKGDKISLYWIGSDGLTQNNTAGTFTNIATPIAETAMTGASNAVFRTEDGKSFTAEAVVYEGYNMLVYPANTAHVTSQAIEVSLPAVQKADEDFTKNVIYVGDSIMQIHQPALNTTKKAYYNMYGEVATVDDANTSGYAHGVKAGVKLLTSILQMKLVIENTAATDVKIQKVELTSVGATKLFSTKGGLVPGELQNLGAMNQKAKYTNPWYAAGTGDNLAQSIVLDCSSIETNQKGTDVTMLMLPANITSTDLATATGSTGEFHENQPVLKVYTNYGVVTIGGAVATGDAHSNCIFASNGTDYAADDDNAALQQIVFKSAKNTVKTKLTGVGDATKTVDYVFNSGILMPRVIKVDMQKAVIQNQHVSNTAELNAILNAAVAKASKYTATAKLNIILDGDEDGNFELTDYSGLDAFAKAGGNVELKSVDADATNNIYAVTNINVNTTSETVLKNVPLAANTITLTIPATSKIATVEAGKASTTATQFKTIANPIINESEITVPAWAEVTIANNKNGTIHYKDGAKITMSSGVADAEMYGVVDYTATTLANLNASVKAPTAGDAASNAGGSVNYVIVKNITSGFFAGGIDVIGEDVAAKEKGGVTVEFDNCGKLNETVSNSSTNAIKAAAIVLSNGTSYPDMTNLTATKVVVDTDATLGMAGNAAKTIATVEVKSGNVDINNVTAAALKVAKDATATVGAKSFASTNLTVLGTLTYNGKNHSTSAADKVFTFANDGKLTAMAVVATESTAIVTGTLNLNTDLAYKTVKVSETTKIVAGEGVKGLGYSTNVYVTKDAQAKGTENLLFKNDTYNANKYSWNGAE